MNNESRVFNNPLYVNKSINIDNPAKVYSKGSINAVNKSAEKNISGVDLTGRRYAFPGQAPYSLKETLEKANEVGVKQQRIVGKTATAPIILKGAVETVNANNESEKKTHSVAIFKYASDQNKSLKRTLEKFFKKIFGIRRPTELLPGGKVESKAYAEKLAFDFSSKFNFNVVTETNFAYIDPQGDVTLAKPDTPSDQPAPQLGTAQVFAKQGQEGFKEAKVHMKDQQQSYETTALDEFQKTAILSYIIGGIDSHLSNIMSQKNQQGQYTGFILIDNGNSFFEEFPEEGDKQILANYCAWGKHPLSDVKTTPEVKAIINDLTPEKIKTFMEQSKKEMKGVLTMDGKDYVDTFFSAKMIDNTLKRLEVVKKVLENDGTLKELSNIKTGKQTEKYLQKNMS